MESDSNSNSIKRKRVIKLVFIASFCIALLFVFLEPQGYAKPFQFINQIINHQVLCSQ